MEQVKYPNYPLAQQDFRDLVANVAVSWTNHPMITLLWTTESEFATKSAAFGNLVNQRISTGAGRQPSTDALKTLDEFMDDHLPNLKGYIIGKWGMDPGPSHYASFGIVHRNNAYIWPTDRNERKTSLTMCVSACTAAGFTGPGFEFDSVYWDTLRVQYELYLNSTTVIDGQVADFIGARDVLRGYLERAMDALLLSIRANYPETFRNTWRNWGWQAEDF